MGRVAIVTGSSRGIGRAVALRLAQDGYDVAINDIAANKAGAEEVAKEIQGLGRKSTVAIADVSKLKEVEAMIQHAVNELGPLNTMVANAGIAQVKALLDLTEEDFENMFRVNVFGVNNCYQAAAKQIIKQGNATAEAPAKLIGVSSSVLGDPDLQAVHRILTLLWNSAPRSSPSNPLPSSLTTLPRSGLSVVSRKPMQWRWPTTTLPSTHTHQVL